MTIGVAIGDPFEFFIPPANLNGGTGRALALNNTTWLSLAASEVKLVTTATVGSRSLVIQIKDVSGNQIVNFTNGSLVASTTCTFPLGGGGTIEGVINQAVPGNQTIGLGCAWPILIPPGSSFVMFDSSNIDVNDQISGTLVLTT